GARLQAREREEHRASERQARKKFPRTRPSRQIHSFYAEDRIQAPDPSVLYMKRNEEGEGPPRSAVAERQQIIERAQLDQDTVQQVAVARRDRLRDQREPGLGAVDQPAQLGRLAQGLAGEAVAAVERIAVNRGLAGDAEAG